MQFFFLTKQENKKNNLLSVSLCRLVGKSLCNSSFVTDFFSHILFLVAYSLQEMHL